MYRTDVRRAAADPAKHGTRRLTLLDSSVVPGAVAKGRSSSRLLNGVLRLAAVELLAADIQPGTLPVSTTKMPADPATRRGRTRSAAQRPPLAWSTALDASFYGPFDNVYAATRRRIPPEFFPAVPLSHSDCV